MHVYIVQMFQALARDRLERLNASPSATPWTYFRVYSVLLLVFFVDIFWYCHNFGIFVVELCRNFAYWYLYLF